jgi:hypothetical protein
MGLPVVQTFTPDIVQINTESLERASCLALRHDLVDSGSPHYGTDCAH